MARAFAWTADDSGIRLSVRLTPKSSLDRVDGVEIRSDGQALLKAYVRSAPEDGKANAALIKLLARTMGVPASAVSLINGAKGRAKILRITGDAAKLMAVLEARFTGYNV